MPWHPSLALRIPCKRIVLIHKEDPGAELTDLVDWLNEFNSFGTADIYSQNPDGYGNDEVWDASLPPATIFEEIVEKGWITRVDDPDSWLLADVRVWYPWVG